uniref:C-type lectin domain-containing protein n=1 Tax=Astyanax mexicanus TaxID=7994 RepID=A0A8B9LUL1_ASTMX
RTSLQLLQINALNDNIFIWNLGEMLSVNKILTQWTWIGFYRDGWKWSDNTSVTSIKWSLFQPDNFGGNQYCARLISIVFSEFSGIMPGWFDDLLCADLHAFFCQSRKFNLVDLTSDVGKQ